MRPSANRTQVFASEEAALLKGIVHQDAAEGRTIQGLEGGGLD